MCTKEEEGAVVVGVEEAVSKLIGKRVMRCAAAVSEGGRSR